jgi:D-amino peptidase
MRDRTNRSRSSAARRTVRPGLFSSFAAGWLLVLACFIPRLTAQPLRIYIVAELEGASGVYQFAQTHEPPRAPAQKAEEYQNPLREKAREYLMGDIGAVVRGLRDANVTDIVVLDGDTSQAFIPDLMEPGAKYITGKSLPSPLPELDKSFAGLIQLGARAMMGTADGVLSYTKSPRTEDRYWYNGVESGELAQHAAIAGHYGVPTIMVTGDVATCREATKFFGPNCVTVAVKRGISRQAAELYPFKETRQALYDGARSAVAAISKCQPYRLSLPIHAEKEYLLFENPSEPGRRIKKGGTIDDVLKLMDF